jgi:tetratricopeptide (TPR) repeat protein
LKRISIRFSHRVAAKLYLGRDEEAIAWIRRGIERNRNYPVAQFYLAAALAHLGRLDEARSATEAGLALDPNFTVSRFRPRLFYAETRQSQFF